MATIFDTVELVKKFSESLGPGAGSAGSFDAEVLKRAREMRAPSAASTAAPAVAAAPTTSGGTLRSAISKAAPRLGILGTFMSLMSSGEAGAGSDVIADASTGEALPRAGTPLSPDMARRANLPTSGAPLTPTQVSSVRSAVDETQATAQAQADAKAQAFTDARTARVNQLVAESRAEREQEAQPVAASNERAARMKMLEEAISSVALPDASLYKGGFATLPALFSATNRFTTQRGQLNRIQKQEFEAQQKQMDRENLGLINMQKLQQEFAKAMKPDFKIATVKSGLSEQPVVLQNGQPTNTLTVDEKGNVTVQPVKSRPTVAQAHAQAKARIEASSNKSQTKILQNKQLQELGYPPLP